MLNRHTCTAALVSAILLSACSEGGGPTTNETLGNPDDPTDSRLRNFASQEAFYTAVRGALINNPYGYGGAGGDGFVEEQGLGTTGGDGGTDGGAGTTGGADGGDSGGAESAPDSNGSADTDSSSSPDVSDTNVQEEGVDEADRIKTTSDGTHLYVLQANYGQDDSVPGPVPEPLPTDQADSTQPSQYGGTTLRVLSLDASAPDATPISNVEFDFGGRLTNGMYLHETENSKALVLTSSGTGYYDSWDDSYAYADSQTIITRADVSNPESVTVTANIVLDGSMVSSRRIGDHLYFASRHYPQVPGADPYSMEADAYRAAVENADIASLMPTYTIQGSGNVQQMVDAANCFVARSPVSSDYYYSPDIITLGVVDLNSMQLTDSVCFLGDTETLYASPNAVFLATTQWNYDQWETDDGSTAGGAIPPDSSAPVVQTDIHQFGISSGSISYAGSGTVQGHLGWSTFRRPFRMSEKDGYLRVAALSGDWSGEVSPVVLSVLQAGDNGYLNTVASLPNEQHPEKIGKPGEELYASRFLGDKAYLVTFRQTDPLYVVDLSNPADPYLAGELEIDGYSDYLHPINQDYLLGIGKDAISDAGGNGIIQGIKLSLFNVSNPAEPREVQSLVVGERGTEAEALYNHLGITVQRANDQHPTRVAFGINVAGNPNPGPADPNDPWSWNDWNYTGLHGFEIRTGADAGIVSMGAMKVESYNPNTGSYYPRYGQDRSVLVNDSVFYVHGPGVYAGSWTNLENYVGPR